MQYLNWVRDNFSFVMVVSVMVYKGVIGIIGAWRCENGRTTENNR